MSSKSVTEKSDNPPGPPGYHPAEERAPSILRGEEPTFARFGAYVSLLAVVVGTLTLILRNAAGWQTIVPNLFAVVLLVAGVIGLLFHAVADRDENVRRIYWALGLAWLAAGVALPLIPRAGTIGVYYVYCLPCLLTGLLFLLACLRHETDAKTRELTLKIIGGGGAALALVGFIGGNARMDLFYLAWLPLIAVPFLVSFVHSLGISDDRGYQAGAAIGGAGAVVFLVAAVRSFVSPGYLVPFGLAFMGLGLLYVVVSVFLCSDKLFVVLTRRELLSFFCSPIAYIVLFGGSMIAWISYQFFLFGVIPSGPQSSPLVEPILREYLWGLLPIFTFVLMLPLLSMRLFSEEMRLGTYEMLMTAPVNETTVVLSKFAGVMVAFLLAWLPWVLFLGDLWLEGGKEFDYRPLLTFGVMLTFIGANFLSMGLFFSSLTSSQIASAILTAGAVLGLTFLSLIPWWFRGLLSGYSLVPVVQHMAYLQHWLDSVGGILPPRALLFHLSATVFWLFLTVKVLESRRWA